MTQIASQPGCRTSLELRQVKVRQRGRFAANESQLAEVATDSLTHSDESTVDVAGSLAHANCGRQRNKSDNQQVLDQSLATLVVMKSLQQSEHSAQVVIVPLSKIEGLLEQGVILTTMVQKFAASASPGQSSPPARGCPNIVVGDAGAPNFQIES